MGIHLTLPAAVTSAKEKKGVVISIDKGQKIYLQENPLPEGLIRSRIFALLSKEPKLQVILRAHHLTPYSMVIRVLDEIRLAGGFDVVLEAKKKPNRDAR